MRTFIVILWGLSLGIAIGFRLIDRTAEPDRAAEQLAELNAMIARNKALEAKDAAELKVFEEQARESRRFMLAVQTSAIIAGEKSGLGYDPLTSTVHWEPYKCNYGIMRQGYDAINEWDDRETVAALLGVAGNEFTGLRELWLTCTAKGASP